MKNIAHLFNHPTTCYFVDDDHDFLQAVSCSLANRRHVLTFANVKEFLPHIMQYDINQYTHAIENIYQDTLQYGDYTVFNIEALLHFIDNQQRFNLPSVALVDFIIPPFSGYDICRQFSQLPTIKIILTGYSDPEKAIFALNQKQIDMHIQKDHDKFILDMQNNLDDLELKFFTKIISASVNLQAKQQHFKFISSNSFYPYLQRKFLHAYNIVEYYAIDSCGSLLGVDQEGGLHWLFIADKALKNYFHQLAQASDIDDDLNRLLTQEHHLPILLTEEASLLPVEQWHHLLLPFTQGNDNLFYAITHGQLPGYEQGCLRRNQTIGANHNNFSNLKTG